MNRFFLGLLALLSVGAANAADVPVKLTGMDFKEFPPLQIYRVDRTPAGGQAMIAVDKLDEGKEVLLYVGGASNYTAYSGKVEGWTMAGGAAAKVTPQGPVTLEIERILAPWNGALICSEGTNSWDVVWLERPDPNMGIEEWKDPSKKGPEEFGNSILFLAKYGVEGYAEIWSRRTDRKSHRFAHLSMVGPAGREFTPDQEKLIVAQGLREIMKNHFPGTTVGDAVEELKKK